MLNTRAVSGTIVVALDTTATSQRALTWAARRADVEGRSLTLVHAVGREVVAWIDATPFDIRDVLDGCVTASERLFAEARAEITRISPDVDVHVVTRMGGIQEALLGLASGAAMIVVGAHTDDDHPTPALDAVQFLVDAGLPCPVVVLGRELEGPGRGIMVLADGTPASAPSVAYAFAQAQRHDLKLSVVHCLEDLPASGPTTDLTLMDQMARMEAGLGASTLGFQQTLLLEMVTDIARRFPTVDADLVLEHAVGDDLLGRATEMDALVFDRRYSRRMAEHVLSEVTSGELRGVVTLHPVAQSPASGADRRGPLLDEGRSSDQLVPVRVRRIPPNERATWRYPRRPVDGTDFGGRAAQ